MIDEKRAALPANKAKGAAPAHASNVRELSDKVVKAAESARGPVGRSTTSLAQLKLAHMRLHGREADLNLLRAKQGELATNGGSTALPEIILVSGVSGTGKTALVKRGLREPAQKMGMTFVSGKFDVNQAALPLSAFAEAMAPDVGKIFAEEDRMWLSGAMPGSDELLGIERGKRVSVSSHLSGGKEAVSRQQYAIKRLLKTVCTHLNGLVLFIDDLQWADIATLDLLNSISLAASPPFSSSGPTAKTRFQSESTNFLWGFADNVKSLVAEALGIDGDEDKVDALATTVHNKTEGNAFFVLMFLRSLYDEQLLQYNFGLESWVWDDAMVKSRLVADNVATMMVNKLKRLGATSQSIIKIASCLGASFSPAIVATVQDSLAATDDDDETDSISTVSRSSKEFEDEGLWEIDDDGKCRFSHDKVQSAAFDLIPSEERDSFRSHIGDVLTKKLDPQSLDDMLLEVVSLRDCSVPSTADERKALAGLNLKAGLRASSNAAFDTAVVYFRAGRELLGANAWDEDENTMVALCSEEANACFVLGDLDQMDSLIDEVLSKDIPIKLKFKANETKILALNVAGKWHESIETALDFRRQLGLKSFKNKPASTVTVLAAFFKTNRALGARTAEDIASLPPLEDERIMMGQRMLELLLASSYMAQQTIYPLVSFLLVRESLEHGANASTVDGFSSFGAILCGAFGRLKDGREMAKAVELLLENPVNRRIESRACFLVQGAILHWTAPLQGTLAPLLSGYQAGLEIGDIESAGFCLHFRTGYLFYAGRGLEGLEKELEANVSVLRKLNLSGMTHVLLVYLIAVKKLRASGGPARPSFRCSDEEMTFRAIYKVADDTGSTLLRAFANIAELELLTIDQNWEAASSFLVECGDLRPLVPGFFPGVRFTFFESLIYFKASQMATGWFQKRKFRRKGCKSMALMSSWLKKGNVNVLHSLHLLAAERHALEGNATKAEEEYKAAIAVSSQNGFLQDRALAHNLARAYYAAKGDDYWAKYHLECAEKLYSDWGARVELGKATQRRTDATV
ncbi:hypothetical protein ACHAXT_005969 [Thalassiosira profunda]